MKIKVQLRRILAVTLSLLYIASASPITFAAIKLNHGYPHSVKLSFDDGHLDLIFEHQENSSGNHDSKSPYDHDHTVHIQEEQSRYSSAEVYSAPDLAFVSDALSKLILTSLPEVKAVEPAQPFSDSHQLSWVKLRTVMLI